MTYKTAKKLFEGYVFSHTKQDNRCGYRTIEMISPKDDEGKWVDIQLNYWDIGDDSSTEIRIFQYREGITTASFMAPLELVKSIGVVEGGIDIHMHGRVVVNIKHKLEPKEETTT